MDDHRELEPYQPPSPAGGFLQIILGAIFLLLVIVGLIAGYGTVLQTAPILVKTLIIMVLVALPAWFLIRGGKEVYTFLHHIELSRIETQARRLELDMREARLEAMRAAQRRADEEHATRLHLMRTRLPANTEGNRDFIYDERSGQVLEVQSGQFIQPVPHHFAPRFEYRDTSTRVSEEAQPAQHLLPPPVAAPTIESIIGQLPYNELMTAYGVTLAAGKLITASIPEAVHFKLVGGSGFGKSCEAAALLRIATLCNDPDHLQIALLDLEHKTSRLFEHLPHVTTVRMGRKAVEMAMHGPSADEVAYKLGALVYELQRRAARNIETPVLLIYVEEMLSLQYEVDASRLSEMLDNLAILAVRGRKYGLFLEACTQADYSTQQLKVAQKQFRSRIAFAIDPTAARASGFSNTELIKQNFQSSQPGQFVLEKPGFSQLMVAPLLDVKQELKRLEAGPSKGQDPTSGPAEVGTSPAPPHPNLRVVQGHGTRGGKLEEVDDEGSVPSRSAEPLSPKAQAIAALLKQRKGQNEIIQEIWGVSGGRAYQVALEEYRAIVAQLLERGA